ncbi:PRS55 protease, partial [Baryphthengus martii]|nr:PRS55 protease [Baryphthengus martii]
GKHICGGTIISTLWILTAAQCFAEELPPDLTVVVGGIDLILLMEEHESERLILHESFGRMGMENDTALILLSSPIEFSKEKIPICLPFISDVGTWQHCWVAGWGTMNAGEMPSGQRLRMKLISRERCLERIPELEENVLCAELKKREREAN